MNVTFSAEEIARLEATAQALLSPLASPDVNTWRDLVLQRLTDLLQADTTLFSITAPAVSSPFRLFGSDESIVAPWLSHYQYIDPANEVVPKLNAGIISSSIMIDVAGMSPAEYHALEIYNDFYKPYHLEESVGLLVEPNLNHREQILFGASASLMAYCSRYGTELFGDKGVVMMRLLRPALLAGVELMHALAGQRASLERALDLMQEAAWLCTTDGAVLHQNAAMNGLLAADPEQERLKVALSAGARTLARLARSRPEPGQATSLPVELPTLRTLHAPYRVRGSLLQVRGSAQAPGMIVILERLSPGPPSAKALQERFGLTRQEARVALLLAARWHNDEIAEHLSISPNTARRHTDSVLFKLGIHSRDEVAALIRQS